MSITVFWGQLITLVLLQKTGIWEWDVLWGTECYQSVFEGDSSSSSTFYCFGLEFFNGLPWKAAEVLLHYRAGHS